MENYLDMIGSYGIATGGTSTGLIVSIVIALIGTVAAAYFLFGSSKRPQRSGFMLKLFSHVNFESFIFAMIVKTLYVFIALFIVVYGISMMFSGSFVIGLLLLLIGPIVVRIYFELMMVFLSILEQIKETNRLLRGGAPQPHGREPQQYGRYTQQGGNPEPQQQDGYARQTPPQYGRSARSARSESGGQEPQPEQPKHYPGGYDPLHRG